MTELDWWQSQLVITVNYWKPPNQVSPQEGITSCPSTSSNTGHAEIILENVYVRCVLFADNCMHI